MKEPKILIGCPTSEHKKYCLKEYVESVKRFTYKNFDFLMADNSESEDYFNEIKKLDVDVERVGFVESARERIVNARNLLRETFLNGDYDYFFSLEQDVIAPRDVIERLLNHGKEITSGVYFKEYNLIKVPKELKKKLKIEEFSGGYHLSEGEEKELVEKGNLIGKKIYPLLYKRGKEGYFSYIDLVSNKGLIEVDACGLGCVMISRKVLERVKFRFEKSVVAFDDIWFCKDAFENGFKIYADLSVRCRHLMRGMNWDNLKK